MEDRHETGRGDANLLKIWQLERCLKGVLHTDERSFKLQPGRMQGRREQEDGCEEEQCGAWPRTPASLLFRPALDRASMIRSASPFLAPLPPGPAVIGRSE